MITPQQFRNPQVKPPWQLPVGVMESVVAYNCKKYGMPRPVIAMPMWEGAGNRVVDFSGLGNHGILYQAPNWVANGLDFNGAATIASNYVNLPNPGTIFDGKHVSVSAWIKGDTWANTFPRIVDRKYNCQFIFHVHAANSTLCWCLYTAGGNLCNGAVSTVSVSIGTLYHAAMTYDGSDARTYLDGDLKQTYGTGISGGLDSYSNITRIGNRVDANNHAWDGLIGNVIVHNVGLTTPQVKFLHDYPYFMYQIPEEIYGKAAAVSGNWFLLQAQNKLQGMRGLNG